MSSVPVAVLALALVAVAIGVVRCPQRERYRRGALVRARRPWRERLVALRSTGGRVTLAGIPIRAPDEFKHFKLIGTTGTGKSTGIAELLAAALRRGDRAVVSDPDGSYAARFASRQRGDALLNPFEPESLRWDVYGELHHPYDCERLAGALIPPSADPAAQEWRGYARTFMAAILRRSWAIGEHDLASLWRLIAVASGEELRGLVVGTPAQPFLDPDNARMFASIRSVAVSAMAALEFIVAQRAAAFSVRKWIRSGRGVLFLPYRAGQIAALRSVISAWLRLAIIETMQGAPDRDQRLWFVVDELDALGAIDGLKDALARLRKFGGRCLLGFQSVAQVSSMYGHGDAQTIIENCGNTLILRCSGSEQGGTSQFASRLIGEREVIRRQLSRSQERGSLFAAGSMRRTAQVTEQPVIENAVLASELEQLADLNGFLKTASSARWQRVRLRLPSIR
ncbi:MAG: type IV secretion system DNA-binding domain-containing protein [Steroidobacteraceae bacterium]